MTYKCIKTTEMTKIKNISTKNYLEQEVSVVIRLHLVPQVEVHQCVDYISNFYGILKQYLLIEKFQQHDIKFE